MIPRTFGEWQNCIVNDCKIPLTKEFAMKRLAIYQDNKNPETQNFVELYGAQHLKNIVNWLTTVLNK